MELGERNEGGVSGYIESLRRERDRFVALAFCAADLLLEINSESNITYAAGATQSLVGKSPEQLTGKFFPDLIAPDDRILVDELIRSMTEDFSLAFMTTAVGLPVSAILRTLIILTEARSRS